jgi:anti-sigma regulatory factor (Ser/Thr protein kinase)
LPVSVSLLRRRTPSARRTHAKIDRNFLSGMGPPFALSWLWVAATHSDIRCEMRSMSRGVGMKQQLDLPISQMAVIEARRLAADAYREVATEEELDNILLLTSELVTNAIRHSGMSEGDIITVVVDDDGPGGARISVSDRGPGFSPSSFGASPSELGTGWGLQLVEALSDAWGLDHDADGFSVWAEVGLSG